MTRTQLIKILQTIGGEDQDVIISVGGEDYDIARVITTVVGGPEGDGNTEVVTLIVLD